jgi:hypothetical protein
VFARSSHLSLLPWWCSLTERYNIQGRTVQYCLASPKLQHEKDEKQKMEYLWTYDENLSSEAMFDFRYIMHIKASRKTKWSLALSYCELNTLPITLLWFQTELHASVSRWCILSATGFFKTETQTSSNNRMFRKLQSYEKAALLCFS